MPREWMFSKIRRSADWTSTDTESVLNDKLIFARQIAKVSCKALARLSLPI